MLAFLFGKKKKNKRSPGKVRKPPANLLHSCRKYRIKVTRKVGKRRVYKSISVLKKQLRRKQKVKHRRRRARHLAFGESTYRSQESANKKCGGSFNVKIISDGKERYKCNTGTKIAKSEERAKVLCGNYNYTKISHPLWKCVNKSKPYTGHDYGLVGNTLSSSHSSNLSKSLAALAIVGGAAHLIHR